MNIILLGAPGSGKGTQSKLLVEKYKFNQLSTGDLLRSAIKSASEFGKLAQSYMNQGKLVPDDLIVQIVGEYLNLNKNKSIIFDGFPRTEIQATKLNELLENAKSELNFVLYLKINPQDLIDRLTGRRVCAQCGEIYHVHTKPSKNGDKCEVCDGSLVQRKDDHKEVILERLLEFDKNTGPLIEFYKNKEKLITVDAELSTENVFSEIQKKLSL